MSSLLGEVLQEREIIDVQETRVGVDRVDLSGLIGIRNEILEFADLIKKSHETFERVPGYLEQGIEESVGLMQKQIKSGVGVMVVCSLSRTLAENMKNKGIGQYFESSHNKFAIPTSKITGASVLSFKSTPGIYEPVIDLRVQADSDSKVSLFEKPGLVVEQDSNGRWYRVPLNQAVVTILS
jgi:hypothetical protein